MHVVSFRKEKTWILVRRHRYISNPERYSNMEDVVVQPQAKTPTENQAKASL